MPDDSDFLQARAKGFSQEQAKGFLQERVKGFSQEQAKGFLRETDQGSIQLSGLIDVTTVAAYREALREKMGSNASHKLEIDLGGVEIHGTAVIALLISVVRESRKIHKEVLFKNCPENLLAVANACGVAEILGLG